MLTVQTTNAASCMFYMNDPHIQIVADPTEEGHECRLMEIHTGDGSVLSLHFDSVQDIIAFVGLLGITINKEP